MRGDDLDDEDKAQWLEDVAGALDNKSLHDPKDGVWLYDYGKAAMVVLEQLRAAGWLIVSPTEASAFIRREYVE